ncbi:unnamed protein product [Rhodiola kirilowii]
MVSLSRTISLTSAGELTTTHSLLPSHSLKTGPYRPASLAKVIWRSLPMNGRYPRIGRPRGPGGSGNGVFLKELAIHEAQKMVKTEINKAIMEGPARPPPAHNSEKS